MTHTSPDDELRHLGAMPTVPGFAEVLRQRTAAVHREAERAGVLADLIRGRATREAYALLLRNLVPVYAALEAALAARRDAPLVAVLADPRLCRLPALTLDLVAVAGADWARTCALLPQAEAYAAAIDGARQDVPRLVAHAYARYLGDLSGGQILKPVLARTLGLSPGALAFYDFPEIADIGAAKAAVRAALDSVDPESAAAASIVAESIAAFRHNIAVSEAVQAAAG